MAETHHFAVDRRFKPILVLFGFRADSDGVTLADDGTLSVSFGWFHLDTPLSNVVGAHVTNDYRWWKAIGARTSLVDDGLTFGTNSDSGVCIHFDAKVPSPLRRKGHSALTVTVVDCEGLAHALDRTVGG